MDGTRVPIRELTPADAPALERFLSQHRDGSMFLRANARRAGLHYSGLPGQANYVGMFDDGEIVGVAAHCWNGMVLMQAPQHVAELVCAAVAASGRAVNGLSGELAQVRAARNALQLDSIEAMLDGEEGLYALDLAQLVVPELRAGDRLQCRLPEPAERATLLDWRVAYNIEALGAPDSTATRHGAAEFLDAQLAAGHAWVAVLDGEPVALTAFNAVLPDIVQLGGIYTPPALRGRGYAKAVIAASLLAARAGGVARAVLFASNPSAINAYEALGFTRVGAYSLVLFR